MSSNQLSQEKKCMEDSWAAHRVAGWAVAGAWGGGGEKTLTVGMEQGQALKEGGMLFLETERRDGETGKHSR